MNKEKVFHGGKVIKEEGNMVLTAPRNTWDTNYHLYDTEEEKEYLLDIHEDIEPLEYPLHELINYCWKEEEM